MPHSICFTFNNQNGFIGMIFFITLLTEPVMDKKGLKTNLFMTVTALGHF